MSETGHIKLIKAGSILAAILGGLLAVFAVSVAVYLNLPSHPPIREFGLPSAGTSRMSAVFAAIRSSYTPDEVTVVCTDKALYPLTEWYLNIHRYETEPEAGIIPYSIVDSADEADPENVIITITDPDAVLTDTDDPGHLDIGSYRSGRYKMSISMDLPVRIDDTGISDAEDTEALPCADGCAVLIPSLFRPVSPDTGANSADTPALIFVHREYPMESSSIGYRSVPGFFQTVPSADDLSEIYKTIAEDMYTLQGSLEITSCEAGELDGFPCFRLDASVSDINGHSMETRSVLIFSMDRVFAVTACRSDDDDGSDEQADCLESIRMLRSDSK